MKLKDLFDYVANKKKEKDATTNYQDVAIDLLSLMRQEDSKRCTAIFFDSYLGDVYTILPYDNLLNITFGYNDDLAMVTKMLAECAQIKRQKTARDRIDERILKNPANVMIYDVDTKKIIGGLRVDGAGAEAKVTVINQKERASKKVDVM